MTACACINGSPAFTKYQQDSSAENILFMDESTATHNITCSAGFYVASNVCLPACDEWEQSSHQTTVTTSAILLVVALISLISGACVFFGSIIRRDSMFRLPSVFIVYMTISFCAAQTIDSVRIIDNLTSRALFCSSKDLNDSFNHSTIFCKFLGASIQHLSINITLWWLFHIGYLCYKLNFSLFSNVKLNSTCLHITLVILGILLPLPPVLIALFHDDYQYTMTQVPPLTCTSRSSEFTYFSYTLIVSFILMAGVGMLLDLIWTIHKYRKSKEAQLRQRTPELKLLVVLCYFTLLGISWVTYDSMSPADVYVSISSFQEYFNCEATGLPNNCTKSTYDWNVYPVALIMRNVVYSFIPIVNLIYVINWRKAKQQMLRCFRNPASRD